MALTDQVQIRLAGLEENLDLPAFAIDADDFFRSQAHVGADKSNPVLFVAPVADTDDPRRDLLIPAGQYIDREQIFTAAPALFANAVNFEASGMIVGSLPRL